LTAYLTVVSIVFFVIAGEFLLYRMDKNDLYNARLKMLFERFNPKEVMPQRGVLHRMFAFFGEMKKGGLKNMTKKNQQAVQPDRPNTEAEQRMVKKKKKKEEPNGLTKLNPEEETELYDLYVLYKQCSMIYNDKEMLDIMSYELEESKVLTRLAQYHIDEAVINEPATFWALMKVYFLC